MSTYVKAFTADEEEFVKSQLKSLVRSLQGRKLEEGDWTQLYCQAKGVPDQGWSNLPFRDYLHHGVGIEFKLLAKQRPASQIGRSVMHPAATRTISFDEADDANVAKDKVLGQWGAAIETFRHRVAATSKTGIADLRWGVLLWDPDHTGFLYFEERLDVPNPSSYEGRWVSSSHRGTATRNLHIFDRATGEKKYSCTLPRKGAKLQPYFKVPTVSEGAYVFTIEKLVHVPMWVTPSQLTELERRFPGLDPEQALDRLLGK